MIAYSSLRQYWRIKPLFDKCRELTAKYVYGLSYVNYNVLVTNWNSNNVEDILMPSEQKAQDLMEVIASLHQKTTFFKNVSQDTYQEIYENIDSNIFHYQLTFSI